jgi:succinyl-CoA synthetase alpha subunit
MEKMEALESAGVHVAKSPADIGTKIKEALN